MLMLENRPQIHSQVSKLAATQAANFKAAAAADAWSVHTLSVESHVDAWKECIGFKYIIDTKQQSHSLFTKILMSLANLGE